jgi:7-carboxy-7-deazaguanine synthase
VRVNRVYERLTLQGEGAHAGARCTFVRLYGCNLHCVWCDSAETWDTKGLNGVAYPYKQNSRTLTPWQVADEVRRLDVDLVIVTGGEPLLQRDELSELTRILGTHRIAVHVETNGTLSPGDELAARVEYFTVSPKLASAAAGDQAINLPVLAGFARMGPLRAGFKIVVSSVDEIAEAALLYDLIGAHRRARWVMPEGITPHAVQGGLVELTEAALELGMSVTGRQHVMLWGNERGR